MSTRGAVGFIVDEKWYVTYNHSDSYPEYLGMRVLEFSKQVQDWDALRESVRELQLVNDDPPTDEDMEIYNCYYANPNYDEHPVRDWYWLLRDLQGARMFYEIESGNLKHLIDNHTFLADSLFCEWAYVIDLDDMLLRVYKGYQENAPDEKTVLPSDVDCRKNDDGYYPVKMLYAYSLDKLPEFMLGVTNEFKERYRTGAINV